MAGRFQKYFRFIRQSDGSFNRTKNGDDQRIVGLCCYRAKRSSHALTTGQSVRVVSMFFALFAWGNAAELKAQCFDGVVGCTGNIILGTEGDDVLDGDNGPNRICGLGGNDTVSGNGGDDCLNGNGGNDRVYGNLGNDSRVRGGQGNDIVRGGRGNDNVYGDAGDDRVFGDKDTDSVFGGDGNDEYVYRKDDGDDTFDDSSGDDRVWITGATAGDVPNPNQVLYIPDSTNPNHMGIHYLGVRLFKILNFTSSGRIEGMHFGTSTPTTIETVALPNNAPYGFLGALTATNPPHVTGWAFDANTFGTAVVVQVLINGIHQPSLDQIANDERLDVLAAQVTPTAQVGFDILLDVPLSCGDVIEVLALDTDGNPAFNAILPSAVTFGQVNPPVGQLEIGGNADGGGASGWAYDEDEPSEPVLVRGKLDGVTQFEILANLPRPDLLDQGLIPDLNHGFVVPDPSPVPAGVHAYSVFAIECLTGPEFELLDSPVPLIAGTSGDDTLQGAAGSDWIMGNDGHDTLQGLAGDDLIQGGAGDDDISGGDDDDFVKGDAGNDVVNGNAGNDVVRGGMDDDEVRGGSGDDVVWGDIGNDEVWGDLGNDTLFGGPGDDKFFYRPGDGNDTIHDVEGANRLFLMKIPQSQVTLVPDGADLVLQINAPGNPGSIRIIEFNTIGAMDIVYNPINIVMIFADDLGYGDTTPYGQSIIQTPALTQMANEGMLFTDFYSGAPHCPPARNTLMAGKHTGHTAIRRGGILPPEDATLFSELQKFGYRTAMFGKWGLADKLNEPVGGRPHERGFDEFLGFLSHRDAHVYYLGATTLDCNGEILDPYADVRTDLFTIAHGDTVSEVTPPDEYTHDRFVQSALDFIDRNQNRPFFLYLPLTIPHAELVVPGDEPTLPFYLAHPSIPTGGDCAPVSHSDCPQYFHDNPGTVCWEGDCNFARCVHEPYATYAAMISRLDRDVGRIRSQLSARGMDENTLVLFSSDNGPHDAGGMQQPNVFKSTGELAGMKWQLLEGGIRVPMIACWPGTIAPGQVTDEPMALWDLLPTFAELTGFPTPPNMDGLSMLPLLKGDAQPSHEFLYWETFGDDQGAQHRQAVRQDRWKALRTVNEAPVEVELYDLLVDPQETCNLAANPQHCDVLFQLVDIMNTAREDPPGGGFDIAPLHAVCVSKTGQGIGTVTSLDNRINCGIDGQSNCAGDCAGICDCTAFYAAAPPLPPVTLQATVEPGHVFTGWSGPCLGTGDCVFSPNGNVRVVANFSLDCNQNSVPDENEPDCDMDGVPNSCETAFLDTTLFVELLLSATPDPLLICTLDRNGDGILNGNDIQPFIDDLIAM